MVEGLTCFRVDISQKEESMVVLAAVGFLFYEGLDSTLLSSAVLLIYIYNQRYNQRSIKYVQENKQL